MNSWTNSYVSGQKSITQKFSQISTELPSMIVDFELCVEIEKPFPASFLANDYRIMSIRIINAGNVPESWVGSGFTASLPVPKAGLCILQFSKNSFSR